MITLDFHKTGSMSACGLDNQHGTKRGVSCVRDRKGQQCRSSWRYCSGIFESATSQKQALARVTVEPGRPRRSTLAAGRDRGQFLIEIE